PNRHDTQPNQTDLPFYHTLFHELHNHPIQPLLTISHYQIPLPLLKNYRGCTNRNLLHLYQTYPKTFFTPYKHKLKYSITFN
ncbi:family 1 glycosylhydrolase, partial [Bacillus pumilus]|uniref:family 1 glycosylhydrolase n=1 Tax=Bacillus pumilus TaxID=1408 RepID=UPI0011AAE3FF